jgi:hypothetical protein
MYWIAPRQGTTNIFVYLGICSTAGSLSVISCKVGACLGACVPWRARACVRAVGWVCGWQRVWMRALR